MKFMQMFGFNHLIKAGANRSAEGGDDGEDNDNAGTDAGSNAEEGDEEDDEEGDDEEGAAAESDDKNKGDKEGKDAQASVRAAYRRGRADERKRGAAIFSAPEAGGNVALAAHLAFNTKLPAEAAIPCLKTAPAASKGSRLATMMDAAGNPKLGPDGGQSPQSQVSAGWDMAVAHANAQAGRTLPK